MCKLSLVIINDDANEYVKNILCNLEKQVHKENTEIILINKLSLLKSKETFHKNLVDKIFTFNEEIVNKPTMYSMGYKLSQGEFIVFVHADVNFADDFFENLYNRINKGREHYDFVSFSQYYVDHYFTGQEQLGIDYCNLTIHHKELYRLLPDGVQSYLECTEACFMISRNIMRYIPFNEKYNNGLYVQDLLCRIKEQKGKIVVFEECEFYHYFIELHEKLKTDQVDKAIFISNNMYIFNNKRQESRVFELSCEVHKINSEISELKHLIDEKAKTIETNTKIIEEKQAHIELLLQKERELNNIYESDGWRLLLKYYKIRDIIFKPKSKFRLIIKLIYKAIKNPNQMVRQLNKNNFMKFKTYLKTDDISVLEERINRKIEVKKPIELKLNILNDVNVHEKIIFSEVDNPIVSIIIPVYNQYKFTYCCLKSIYENTKDIEYEIIVADDVSNDETKKISNYITNIKVIRNEKNLGFLLNCNNAAKEAKGKYILFLNNDTNVQRDWLKYLIDLIESDKKIGMVGSKLVYQDGRLQEAGGIIWNDASGWNYGRLDDSEKFEYNYVKEVDYISGASIMIRRDLWKAIGGFDERYVPAYFEDADLAFEVRKRGFKVVYQPKSIVVHFEGISNGKDENNGVKMYQVKNREKFLKKWEDTLQKEHFNNGENVFIARDRSKDKKTILVIDHYVPTYDKDAGSRTMYQYLKLFVEMGLNVKFLGDNFAKIEPYTSELEKMGIEVLYGSHIYINYKKWLKENGEYIDYTYLLRPHIASNHIDLIKKYTKSKILYNGTDFNYLREVRQYKISKDITFLNNARRLKKQEFQLFARSNVVYTISEYEKKILNKKLPEKRVVVIPTFIYDSKFPLGKDIGIEHRKTITFVGGFSHAPNVDGVKWFVKDIFPLILKSIPDVTLNIIGSNPTQEILSLKSKNIRVVGYVSDEELENYYSHTRVIIAPLRFGAGVKGKVIESIAYGIPVITTSIGIEGIQNGEEVIVVSDDELGFAQNVINISNNDTKWLEIRKKQINYAKELLGTEYAKKILKYDISI